MSWSAKGGSHILDNPTVLQAEGFETLKEETIIIFDNDVLLDIVRRSNVGRNVSWTRWCVSVGVIS